MTLIVTIVNELGLLQLSDSELTAPDTGEPVGTGTKLFPLVFCRGALAVAGSYVMNGTGMDDWMPQAIAEYSALDTGSVEGFARFLQHRLTEQQERGITGMLVQIAGYVRDDRGSHPEMWFVRNFDGIDPANGDYVGRSNDFGISEDYWDREYGKLLEGGHVPGQPLPSVFFFNGVAEGRISFKLLNRYYLQFLEETWRQPALGFSKPTSIEDYAQLMKHELEIIASLFRVNKLNGIGGDVQHYAIPRPKDVVVL